MARSRPRQPGAAAGSATIAGQLAERYRLGRVAGVANLDEALFGRPRLETPEELFAAADAAGLLPSEEVGRIVSRDYICKWFDVDTGELIIAIRSTGQGQEGTTKDTLYRRARRNAEARFKEYRITERMPGRHLRTTCQFIRGSERIFPTAGSI